MMKELKQSLAFTANEILITNIRALMRAEGLNEAELCRKTGIPQTTLHKILAGQTEDPRTSTLKLIADFFGTSIDSLLSSNTLVNKFKADIQPFPVITWSDCLKGKEYIAGLSSSNWNNWVVGLPIAEHAYALSSKPSMEPRFPKGTILFIDPDSRPKDGSLVIVHYLDTDEATVRELSSDGPTKLLLPISGSGNISTLEENIKILGTISRTAFSFE